MTKEAFILGIFTGMLLLGFLNALTQYAVS
jgi:hypothetical protein